MAKITNTLLKAKKATALEEKLHG